MGGGGCAWSRRSSARTRTLRGLMLDTQRALQQLPPELMPEDRELAWVQSSVDAGGRPAALVLLGRGPARVRLLHALLGRGLLPDCPPKPMRAVRVLQGSPQEGAVRVSAGLGFEVVEPLACQARAWSRLPAQDLRAEGARRDTVLEVRAQCALPRERLSVLLPPDLGAPPPAGARLARLVQLEADALAGREALLRNFECVFLFALDEGVACERLFAHSDLASEPPPDPRDEGDFWAACDIFGAPPEDRAAPERAPSPPGPPRGPSAGVSYAIDSERCLELHQIKKMDPNAQVLFVLLSDGARKPSGSERRPGEDDEDEEEFVDAEDELPEVDRHFPTVAKESPPGGPEPDELLAEQTRFMRELMRQWEAAANPPRKHYARSEWAIVDERALARAEGAQREGAPREGAPREGAPREGPQRLLKSRPALLGCVTRFAADCALSACLAQATRLGEVGVRVASRLVGSSFSLARALLVLPQHVSFSQREERRLYQAVLEKFSLKSRRPELLRLLQLALDETLADVMSADWAAPEFRCHRGESFVLSELSSCRSRDEDSPSDGEEATAADSDDCSDYVVVEPCADEGEGAVEGDALSLAPRAAPADPRRAELDVQHAVLASLSRRISCKLLDFVDCLRDSYFGTLQRCVEQLERQAGGAGAAGARSASACVRRLLSAARQVELRACVADSALRGLLARLRRLFAPSAWQRDGRARSAAWRREEARRVLRQLSAARLADLVAAQISERIRAAHSQWGAALAALEAALADRLGAAESSRQDIRNRLAPTWARLCLEASALSDLLRHGLPELGKEIGRGQYGVVYAVGGAWAGRGGLCAKSGACGQQLALEFLLARALPPHPRLARALGCVRWGPRVLLLAPRFARDLQRALRQPMGGAERRRVALDVAEGLRQLHALGLLHRDVKPKNVLLDERGRAALSDLGFCAVAALVSGSVVGTPVHMAPELLRGHCSPAVDVYAFAVLFWYLCANSVSVPGAFEGFQNKEQLWSRVRRGLRPERLPWFSAECWELMRLCWHQEPARRLPPGEIQRRLEEMPPLPSPP